MMIDDLVNQQIISKVENPTGWINSIGCCIIQSNRPLFFASCSLTPTDQQYSQFGKGLLSVVLQNTIILCMGIVLLCIMTLNHRKA
ncbi:hypothetical protein J437_LFUL015220 [Ladona fulva]|uniref:Reverse transcriptase/retrotransposon-derived protein RNase H-like domain-containing protein n=1 Tax=Ladona fulva TaxID=123851 RepID=A0A8K0KGI3_LADFU|nr:hypothetical protein J437_LFUL015220 [Ladona fulva]